ncbi:MAG: methylmalonyl Co-A mutase-associated GTPase MeaB [Magnetococcales bacterium]|nr:methylmalonyl Co-A mutase-associated GTPase MeaB [Magnetococcales bacterium]
MTPEELAEGILRGERRALAKGITLIESSRPEDELLASALLDRLSTPTVRGIRVGISGPPGAGKSTLIESLGMLAVGKGVPTAVLAIDPSSRRSGGSILGDKTRMPRLSAHPLAFIRPTATGGVTGGVARRTRESMVLLEAAGFELILVETVGVGQSETEVHGMVDLFTLVLLPNAGDELQGIKRGIMELAELIVINKADGTFRHAAETTAAQVNSALPLLHHDVTGWMPRVLLASALEESGIEAVYETIQAFRQRGMENGELEQRRLRQATAWMWERVHDGLRRRFLADPTIRRLVGELEPEVRNGTLGAVAAAERLLQLFFKP